MLIDQMRINSASPCRLRGRNRNAPHASCRAHSNEGATQALARCGGSSDILERVFV